MSIKMALAPGSLRVRYFSSVVLISEYDVIFPYDLAAQKQTEMYFEDGLELNPKSRTRQSLMEAHQPFEDGHIGDRLRGTAFERGEDFERTYQGIQAARLTVALTGWGICSDWLEWIDTTLDRGKRR
jgi:hypothetical protein